MEIYLSYSLRCKFLCLLNLLPTSLEWSASLVSPFPAYGGGGAGVGWWFHVSPRKLPGRLQTNSGRVSQETKEMGCRKEGSTGGDLRWALHLSVGRRGWCVGCLWANACVQGRPENAGCCHAVFKELCRVPCDKEGKLVAATGGWPLLGAVRAGHRCPTRGWNES